MSAEQVLRALLVKQLNQFSYRELAFHLADSRSYRTFCQLGIIEPTPSKSTLAANIKAVKFETLEQINRELVSVAEDAGIEKGRKVRMDCTVVESNIHPPTDSELLYDCVRVLTRLMCGARELLGTVVVFGNRTRRAKRRRLGVLNAKDKQQRRRVYRDLLKVTEETYRSAQRVAEQLEESGLTEPVRVIDEERVPAEEKVVSVFEARIWRRLSVRRLTCLLNFSPISNKRMTYHELTNQTTALPFVLNCSLDFLSGK